MPDVPQRLLGLAPAGGFEGPDGVDARDGLRRGRDRGARHRARAGPRRAGQAEGNEVRARRRADALPLFRRSHGERQGDLLMRTRTVLATVSLGALALGACSFPAIELVSEGSGTATS